MIPYGKQSINQSDIDSVMSVLKSDFIAQGPKVKEFEQALAKYTGAKYAVVCNNGTAGLHLAYLTAGLKPGDEVITSPNTFASTCNMLLAIGAKPVFCDIRLDTYNIDEEKIVKLITKRTKAIIPIHFAGQPCEMDKIKKIADKYKLKIITDACHALGAQYKKNKVGSCKYSHMTVFAFHPVKPITTGEGGAVLTNSKADYERLVLLRSHGIYKDKQGANVMIEAGANYRSTDIQAALGVSQLKRLDKFIRLRRQIVTWYQEFLKDVDQIILPQELPHNSSGWHLYIIRTKNPKIRNKLRSYLAQNGIGVNFHYPAVYSHPYYRKHGYKNTRLKNEDIYHNSCITLCCYPGLEKKQVKYICDHIKSFFKA